MSMSLQVQGTTEGMSPLFFRQFGPAEVAASSATSGGFWTTRQLGKSGSYRIRYSDYQDTTKGPPNLWKQPYLTLARRSWIWKIGRPRAQLVFAQSLRNAQSSYSTLRGKKLASSRHSFPSRVTVWYYRSKTTYGIILGNAFHL